MIVVLFLVDEVNICCGSLGRAWPVVIGNKRGMV
jgi:hypothetical protein